MDRTRVDSVINTSGSSFSFKKRQCGTVDVRMPDFLLAKNRKLKEFPKADEDNLLNLFKFANIIQYMNFKNIIIREVLNKAGNRELVLICIDEGVGQVLNIITSTNDFKPDINFKLTMRPPLSFDCKTNQLRFGDDLDALKSITLFNFDSDPFYDFNMCPCSPIFKNK